MDIIVSDIFLIVLVTLSKSLSDILVIGIIAYPKIFNASPTALILLASTVIAAERGTAFDSPVTFFFLTSPNVSSSKFKI